MLHKASTAVKQFQRHVFLAAAPHANCRAHLSLRKMHMAAFQDLFPAPSVLVAAS